MWEILNFVWVATVIISLVTLSAAACKAYFLFGAALKESRLRFAKEVVKISVQAAEQLSISGAMPGLGPEKKNVVRHMVDEIEHLNIDPELLDFMIEAEVFYQFNLFEEEDDQAPAMERHIQG